MFVGALGDGSSGKGVIYVFKNIRNAWTYLTALTPADSYANQNFGIRSVSLYDNDALIPAPFARDNGLTSGNNTLLSYNVVYCVLSQS